MSATGVAFHPKVPKLNRANQTEMRANLSLNADVPDAALRVRIGPPVS